MTEITITKRRAVKGSTAITWDIDRNGRPYGQIWTFKAKGEQHPHHVKTLSGFYRQVWGPFADAEKLVHHLAG